MKKIFLLLIFCFNLTLIKAQVIPYILYIGGGAESTTCLNFLDFYFYPISSDATYTISIDWGDNSSSDSVFTIPAGVGVPNYIFMEHDYTEFGLFTGTYSIYQNTTSTFLAENEGFSIFSNTQTNCGSLQEVNVIEFASGFYFQNVPLMLTNANGETFVIDALDNTAVGVNSNSYFGISQMYLPIEVNINPDWLNLYGLAQLNPGFNITSFISFGNAITDGQPFFNVGCVTAVSEPDVLVNYGFVENFVAPLETGALNLNFCNYACQNTTDATVTIEFPLDFVPNTNGLTNASFASGVLTFDLEDLDACESFNIPFAFPGITPAGTQICFPIAVAASNDIDLSNNIDTICGIVLNSYDPNDKQVNHPATIDPATQEEFVYQIRFQNDGNFPAVNVVVRDTISENLDLSTFRLLETSHPAAYQVNPSTREITFTFSAIWLESSEVDLEASQGFILYEIDEAAGLVEGDAIENTAHIFFDFNPAIVTNTTVITNVYPVGVIENDKPQLSMYPNPTSSAVTFSGAAVQKVVIYDVLGQVVLTRNINNNTLSLSGLTNGVYFVEMHTEVGVQTQRLVVNK